MTRPLCKCSVVVERFSGGGVSCDATRQTGDRAPRERPAIPSPIVHLLLALLATGSLSAQAPSPERYFLIADSSLDRVVRLQDVDGSGLFDPATPGEVTVFYDDASPGPDLSTPSGLIRHPDGRILLLDGGTLDAVLALEDLNGDADANDADEYSIFFGKNEAFGAPALSTPNSAVWVPDGHLVVADDGRGIGRLLAVEDLNGDGDALDEEEWWVVYDSNEVEASGVGDPLITDPEALAVDAAGRLFVADATAGLVLLLLDHNGDRDVMDAGEVSVYYDPGSDFSLSDPEGLSLAPDGDLFVTDEDTGLVLRLRDLDGNGRVEGADEVGRFVDESAPLAPRDTNDLLVEGASTILVLDGSRDQVFRLTDLDGDGAALSEGEVSPLIAEGERVLGTPSALVAVGESAAAPEFLRGDYNDDDVVELTDAVLNLEYQFLGRPAPRCLDSADVDDNGLIEITDPVRLLEHLFLGDEPPVAPYPQRGADPSADRLACR